MSGFGPLTLALYRSGERGFVGETGDMSNTFGEMSGDFLLRMLLVLPLLYNCRDKTLDLLSIVG